MIQTRGFKKISFLLFLVALSAGCASSQPQESPDLVRINRDQAATIQSLNNEIQRLNTEISHLMEVQPESGLSQAKAGLEDSLSGEVAAGNLDISVEEKGIVVTVLDRVLFDPGRVELKASAMETLNKVADVLNAEAADHIVYVEGHTDDIPIRHSTWRSNWELSTARATEVIHYFVDYKNVNPVRLAATGYGEFQPVVSNETPEGRMKNRRVEIVISPKTLPT